MAGHSWSYRDTLFLSSSRKSMTVFALFADAVHGLIVENKMAVIIPLSTRPRSEKATEAKIFARRENVPEEILLRKIDARKGD